MLLQDRLSALPRGPGSLRRHRSRSVIGMLLVTSSRARPRCLHSVLSPARSSSHIHTQKQLIYRQIAVKARVPTCPSQARTVLSRRFTAAAAPAGAQQRHSGAKIFGGVIFAVGAASGACFWWALQVDKQAEAELQDPAIAVEPPPAEFVHPFQRKSWLWRLIFTIKRAVYIAWVFTPVVAVGAMSNFVFRDSEEWRQKFLDTLMWAVERAGCSFMKLGQWVSMRPDMFPKDLVDCMARLRQGVPPHSYKETRKAIKLAFGKEIEELFESFESEPVASGTVAQVHKAKLWPEHAIHGGITDVAVKVRHPGVLEETFVDLDLIFGFVDTFLPHRFSMPCSQDELAHILRQQLDLKCEAYNLWKFSNNFRSELRAGLMNFPQVQKGLCSENVLVESWVNGTTIATLFSELESGEGHTWKQAKSFSDKFSGALQEKKRELARILFEMNVKMFLRDNYVHGDLHAGNLIFSLEDGRVTVVDAGLITSLKPDVANSFGDFLRALCSSDVENIVEKILQFNVGKFAVDREAFKRRITEVTSKWENRHKTQGHTYALGDMVGEILLSLQNFRIVLRGDVAASIMSISVSEGLILQLDPEFDIVQSTLPFFVRYKGWKSAQAALLGTDE